MMVRLDFSGRSKATARALRITARRAPETTLFAEAGPRLPFRDGSVDEIFGGQAIAWRDDIAQTLDELWRICKPGALIHLTLPHAASVLALSRDPRPRPALTLSTFNYYDPLRKPPDAPATSFAVERATLRVAGQRAQDSGLALARGPFAQFIEKLANGSRGSQYRFERWFAGIIGFEEFDVVLAVVKPAENKQPTQLARPLSVVASKSPSVPAGVSDPVAAADATDLRATSDVAHEALAAETELLPNAAPVESGPPYVAPPFGERGGNGT